MSELTPCNRCTLESMQHAAAKRGVSLIVEVVPPNYELAGWTSARYSDEPEPSAFFQVVPERCEC